MGNPDNTIYVGYLPVPKPYKVAMRLAVPLIVGGVIGLALLLAFMTPSPSRAVWMAEQSSHTGILHEMPYPYLETADGPLLLVEPGKFGSTERFNGLDGSTILVRGTLLERDGWRAIELSGHEFVEEEAAVSLSAADATEIVAIGEILDSKCYLGAMKPGRGRSHRACAILCLRGGIPPLFVGQASSGQQIAGVLAIENEPALPTNLLSLVGERVEVRGSISVENGLTIIRASEHDVTHTD
ncbi:MAG: hypothetical protein Phyf2KO_06580 [Phycisphaerales bacterium]